MRVFMLLQALLLSTAASASTPQQQSTIGYASVAEALSALKAKPGVQVEITKPDAWTIISEPGNVQWSFSPSTHGAYPAVVRRALKVNPDGDLYIEMTALCQAEKMACDKLIEEFKQLNERIRQSVRARLQQGDQPK